MSDGTGIHGVDALVIWTGAIVAISGGLGLLWRLTRGVRQIATRFEEFADDWQGTPARPGVPARPGMMERMARMERHWASYDRRLESIEHEVHPNSGGSMRDALDRVEQRVCRDDTEGRLAGV